MFEEAIKKVKVLATNRSVIAGVFIAAGTIAGIAIAVAGNKEIGKLMDDFESAAEAAEALDN